MLGGGQSIRRGIGNASRSSNGADEQEQEKSRKQIEDDDRLGHSAVVHVANTGVSISFAPLQLSELRQTKNSNESADLQTPRNSEKARLEVRVGRHGCSSVFVMVMGLAGISGILESK